MLRKYKKIFMLAVLSSASLAFIQAKSLPKELKNNVLLQEWNTPYQTPPFSKISNEQYLPAFRYAIKEAKAEIDAICANKQAPSFENTVLAVERAGKLLNRISGVFFNIAEAESTPEIQALSQEVIPLLTEYSNDLSLNEALFNRVKAVYQQKENLKLDKEQSMVLELSYKGFARSGANLNPQEKERYRALSNELSALSLNFKENILKETNAYFMHFVDAKDLSGLPQTAIDQAAARAAEKGKDGWVFDLSMPSVSAFLKYADQRELRKDLYIAYNSRSCQGNENDNSEIIKKIANLRLEMANLLGYKTYADYVLEERMAESSEKVNDFLNKLVDVSAVYAQRDVKELSDFARQHGLNDNLQRWDFAYYSEKLRTERYNVNDEMLKPYLELEKLKSGIFTLANRLFGLKFTPAKDIESYHKDVQIYKVTDETNKLYAVLYLDFYARPTKRAGAWMTSFREQKLDEQGNDVRPLVQLVLNFPAPVDGQPVLLTYQEYTTFLHEFGHALHGMLSECRYESVSGTSVPRDFVELPSQIMENWGPEKEFLNLFAYHYQTKELLPDSLIEKIKAADNFQAGYASLRQLMFGSLDMAWHSIKETYQGDVMSFENKAIEKTELLPLVPGTNVSVGFSHVFGGGYAAGYYGYKWAEVLDADAFSVFKKNGVFDKATAKSFRDNILSQGHKDKPMDLYKRFRGQEPSMDALLERSGMK